MALVMSMGTMALAAEGESGTTTLSTPSITIHAASTAAEGQTDTASYTWYRILEADIAQDPTMDTDGVTQKDGKVAYYVTTEARATALAGLKVPKNDGTVDENSPRMFEVTQVGTTNKWYVSLHDESTNAADIETAFKKQLDLTKFDKGTFAQTAVAGTATSGTVAAGYYYITSTVGMNAVIQTLTAVTINEKNKYVTDDKTIPTADVNSEIGQEITYTLTVNVPATATEEIVLTDTMSKGLTFKEVKSQKIGTTDMTDAQKGTVSAVTATPAPTGGEADGSTYFTITYTDEQVKELVSDGTEKVINIEVTVTVNKDAAIETDIPNTLDMKYGNNYEAKPKTVNTKTYRFSFDKVDGDNTETKLTGAQFKLTKNSTATKTDDVPDNEWINLIEVEAGKTYRVAMSEDTASPVTVITTNGNTVTINGLDADVTYYLWETKAPAGGYNPLTSAVVVKATSTTTGTGDDAATTYSFDHQDIENNKGTVLPSTGGIGTTIFYVVGSILVVAAGVLLITKKRMSREG